MSGPKPTLGYPSRTAAVIALRAQGLTQQAIATRIGISIKSVYALESSARATRTGGPRLSGETAKSIQVARGTLQRLAPHARARGISRDALAAQIVDVVATANLVDAVLDDNGGQDQ